MWLLLVKCKGIEPEVTVVGNSEDDWDGECKWLITGDVDGGIGTNSVYYGCP